MKCELIEKEPAVPQPKPRDIVLNGKIYGEITPGCGAYWHAHFIAIPGCHSSVLLQGFGDTPEDALRNAFDATRAELERHIAEVEECRREMLGVTD